MIDFFLLQGCYDFYDEAWSTVSAEAKDVVKRLLCVDPVKRASLEEILEHKWIRNDLEMICEARKIMNIEEKLLEERGTNKRSLDNSEPNSQNNETIESSAQSNRKRLKNLDLV